MMFKALFFLFLLFISHHSQAAPACDDLFQFSNPIFERAYNQFMNYTAEAAQRSTSLAYLFFKNEKYEILNFYGKGLSGYVYKVRNVTTKEVSVMKEFHSFRKFWSQHGFYRQTMAYYKMNKKLRHPYRPIGYDVGNKIMQFEFRRTIPLHYLIEFLEDLKNQDDLITYLYSLDRPESGALDRNIVYDLDRNILIAIDPL